jgi:hypothetical protein
MNRRQWQEVDRIFWAFVCSFGAVGGALAFARVMGEILAPVFWFMTVGKR